MNIYFDLDGTLIDVFDRYTGILNSYISLSISKELCRDEYIFLKQRGFKDHEIVKELMNYEININQYVDYKRSRLESIDWLKKDYLICDIDNVKRRLTDKGFSMHLITARRNETNTRAQLDWLGLSSIFDGIHVVRPMMGRNTKLEYLKNKDTTNSIIIGDSDLDVECGIALNMLTYFVTTGLQGVPAGMKGYNSIDSVVDDIVFKY